MIGISLQLGIVLGIAVAVSFLARKLKQPLVVGYILTGLIISVGVGRVIDVHALDSFIDLGIALLLFMVGLSLNPKVISSLGWPSLVTGIGQIVFTMLIGYGIGVGLGFTPVTALYIAIAFTFSSTVIIMRLLQDRGDEDALYGRISIGFLIVQDIIAMAILIIVSLFGQVGNSSVGFNEAISLSIFSFSLIILGVWILAAYIVPKIDSFFAKDTETLVLFSLTIAFGLSGIFEWFNFSMEMGALLAGVVLASSPYQREIASRVKPLRDFFLVIFFIALGFELLPSQGNIDWIPVLVFSLFILIGNPLVVLFVMRSLGYSLRTGFMAGLTVAQISEFSLILLTLGVSLGHLEASVLSVGVLVGLITIAGSSYMIHNADELYSYLYPYLRKIEGKTRSEREEMCDSPEVFVFGAHRFGEEIIKSIKKMKTSFLVVDNDPEIINEMSSKKVRSLFGDAGDVGFLESLDLSDTKLIISSIPQMEVNLNILARIKKIKKNRPLFVCVAQYNYEAKELYKSGAHYVVMPPYLASKYMADIIKSYKFNSARYTKERKLHLKVLGK